MSSNLYVNWKTYIPTDDNILEETLAGSPTVVTKKEPYPNPPGFQVKKTHEKASLTYLEAIRIKNESTKRTSSNLQRSLKQKGYLELVKGKGPFESNLSLKLAYLPKYVKNHIKEQKQENPYHHTYRLKTVRDRSSKALYQESFGVILFIDVSGFTALGKEYRAKFKQQPEKASDFLSEDIIGLLNILSTVCYEHGGHIAKFAGDALLCVWDIVLPDTSRVTKDVRKQKSISEQTKDNFLQETLARVCEALDCAKSASLEMQRKCKDYKGRNENTHFSLHGAIAAGNIINFLVGNEKKKRIVVESLEEAQNHLTEMKEFHESESFESHSVHGRPFRSTFVSNATAFASSIRATKSLGFNSSPRRRSRKNLDALKQFHLGEDKFKFNPLRGHPLAKMKARIRRTSSSRESEDNLGIFTSSSIKIDDYGFNKYALKVHLINGCGVDFATRALETTSTGTIISMKLTTVQQFFETYLFRFFLPAQVGSSPTAEDQDSFNEVYELSMAKKSWEEVTETSSLSSVEQLTLKPNKYDLDEQDILDFLPELVQRTLEGNLHYGRLLTPQVSVAFVRLDDLLLQTRYFLSPFIVPTNPLARDTFRRNKRRTKSAYRETLQYLNQTFMSMTNSVHRYQGHVRDLLFDDKGCVFIFAMPGDYSEFRTLCCAKDILKVHVKAKIGISTGPAALSFCGDLYQLNLPSVKLRKTIKYGRSEIKQEGFPDKLLNSVPETNRVDLVFMSPDVNVAARLMGKANNGEILVSQSIKEILSDGYEVFDFEPRKVIIKGEEFSCFSHLKNQSLRNISNIDDPFKQVVHTSVLAKQLEDARIRFKYGFNDNRKILSGNKSEIKFGDAEVKSVMSTFRNGTRAVFFHGKQGSGKSFLAKKVAKSLEANKETRTVYSQLFSFKFDQPFSSLRCLLSDYFRSLNLSKKELLVKVSSLNISVDFLGWSYLLPAVSSLYTLNSKTAALRTAASKVQLESLENFHRARIRLKERLACFKVFQGLLKHISDGWFEDRVDGNKPKKYVFVVDDLRNMDVYSFQMLESVIRNGMLPSNVSFLFTLDSVLTLSLNYTSYEKDRQLRHRLYQLRQALTSSYKNFGVVDISIGIPKQSDRAQILESIVVRFFTQMADEDIDEVNQPAAFSLFVTNFLGYSKGPEDFKKLLLQRTDIKNSLNLKYLTKVLYRVLLSVILGQLKLKVFELAPSAGEARVLMESQLSYGLLPSLSLWLLRFLSVLSKINSMEIGEHKIELLQSMKVAHIEYWLISKHLKSPLHMKNAMKKLQKNKFAPKFLELFRRAFEALLDVNLLIPAVVKTGKRSTFDQVKIKSAIFSQRPVYYGFWSQSVNNFVYSTVPEARKKVIEQYVLLLR
eukprot:augustus_masked-scaffold_4-processed-gene-12.40-mRNA-1 protein AED:1.00 eAED:1.00 QI:0/-1/0/0/-1/1/1/0/1362